MLIMPSRGRPHLIARFFSVAPPQAQGILALDDDDADNYNGISLPQNWGVRVAPRSYFTARVNSLFSEFPNEPTYGFVMDDTVPLTEGWDVSLAEKAGPWGLAWPDDCLPGKRPSALAMGGELVRALGWISCPSIKHFYTDSVWELMAPGIGAAGRCEEIKVAHLHFSSGAAPYDKTYQERPDHAADAASFESWAWDEWPRIKARLITAIPQTENVNG
jgi:hypothetical protein